MSAGVGGVSRYAPSSVDTPRPAGEPPVADVLTAAPARDGRWLSLGPASRLLGVDPDTLRRWADDGRIAAWTTPGGHRRFERRAVERMAAERRPGAEIRPLSSFGASPARMRRIYRRHYATSGSGTTASATTVATGGRAGIDAGTASSATTPHDDRDRDAFRRDGRRLAEALIDYLDAMDDVDARARAEDAANLVVDDQARRLAASAASLTESVSMFVGARQPFLTEIGGLGRRRSMDPARLAALYEDASAVLDRLLLRFIEAHQRDARGS